MGGDRDDDAEAGQVVICAIFAILCAVSPLPDPKLTPGAINPNVTQDNIQTTICVPGWTKTIRPSARYTNNLKRMGMNQYGLSGDPHLYEEDHLISLELGGNSTDPRNLWPEAWVLEVHGVDLGAHTKDRVENYLHREVCSGQMTLSEAQQRIRTNWVSVYETMEKP